MFGREPVEVRRKRPGSSWTRCEAFGRKIDAPPRQTYGPLSLDATLARLLRGYPLPRSAA